MTKKRSIKRNKPPNSNIEQTKNILQTNRIASNATPTTTNLNQNETERELAIVGDIGEIKSILDSDCKPGTSSDNGVSRDNLNTALLYDELDSFRQRWKRELGEIKQSSAEENVPRKESLVDNSEDKENNDQKRENGLKKSDSSDKIYARAKELFLKAVDLERNEMHLESIRYYKEAMHLCPDIEKLIFKEQCAASVNENAKLSHLKQNGNKKRSNEGDQDDDDQDKIPIFEQVRESFYESNKSKQSYKICRPSHKPKGTHISDLPQELLRKLLFYVVGEELDLASLECMATTCRGFYLLARDPFLWKNICLQTWGAAIELPKTSEIEPSPQVDWRQMYLDKPRVNFDGVYISRTRYIRQGDIGFQDLTYRPFHIVRYYRYLRFFPDGRVLILTTNEEPDKIVPIFRHAIDSKQFSSDLSILEGSFEFVGANQIHVLAEKDCTQITANQRRQHQYYTRQTPISQKLNLKFELKTLASKPFRNNVLKWLEYTLLTRLETGQEMDSFDLTYDMFPNLIFSRVKRFNVRTTSRALPSRW